MLNNPLALTDPSGYFSWGKMAGAMFCPICVKEWQRPILSIAVAYYTGQWFSALGWAPIASGAAGGFMSGFVSTGNLNGAMQGAFTGAVLGAAGGVGGANSVERYVAHAAAGCVSAVAASGRCGQGAAAAVFGKYTTNAIEGSSSLNSPIAKGIAAAVAGGVGSMIAGGKFENGAVTAAYGYLFNFLSHATFDRKTGALDVQDGDKRVTGQFFSGTGPDDQIAPGKYAILDRGGKDGFRLEAIDSAFGDDMNQNGQGGFKFQVQRG